MTQHDQIPACLDKAIVARELLVFAGSGISRLEPTGLPTWWEFNELLVEGAKAVALKTVPSHDSEVCKGLSELKLSGSVIAFSDLLVRFVAEQDYWSVLQALDSDRPNANHLAIGDLAAKGIIKALVTTNFDTLIEQVFRLAGVAFRVVVPRRGDLTWTDMETDECLVFKIHGSVSEGPSLVDTAHQKLRGLGLAVRTALNGLYRRHHVLVIGYSGADLDFGRDYLALSAIDDSGPGLTWATRPGEAVTPAVAQVLAQAGRGKAAAWSCEFPAAWHRLGAAPAPPSLPRPVQRSHRELQSRIEAIYKKEPLLTLLLCGQLMLQQGMWRPASHLRRLVSNMARQRKNLVPGRIDSLSMGLLHTSISNDEGQSEVNAWLDVIEQLRPRDTPDLSTYTAVERESALMTEACLLNIRAGCSLQAGDMNAAYEALTRAHDFAEQAGADDVLAVTKLGWVHLMARFNADADDLIEAARQAIALAVQAGNAKTAADAYREIASRLVELCEYDAAIRCLQQAQVYGMMAPDALRSVNIHVARERIAVRRHDSDASADAYEAALEVANTPALVAVVKYTTAELHCFAASFKGLAYRLLGEVDAAMQGGEVPGDGSIPWLPSRTQVTELRRRIQKTHSRDEEPPFFPTEIGDIPDREAMLRRFLLFAEYRWESRTVVECLEELGKIKLAAHRYPRALDLAQSAVAAADRLAVDETLRIRTRQLLARALTELGRVREAKATLAEAMALPLASTNPEARGRLLSDLSQVHRRSGDVKAALPLLTEAVEILAPLGIHDATAYAVIRLADSHLHLGQSEAVRQLLQRFERTLQLATDATSRMLLEDLTARVAISKDDPTPPELDVTASDVDIQARSKLTSDPAELLRLGRAATTGSYWSLAEEILQNCLELLGKAAPPTMRVECHDALAELAKAMSRGAELVERRRQALRLIRESGDELAYFRRLTDLVTEQFHLHQLPGIASRSRELLETATARGPSIDSVRALHAAIIGFSAVGAPQEIREAALLIQQFYPNIPDHRGIESSLDVAQFALASTAAGPA